MREWISLLTEATWNHYKFPV